mmetsp:Transcript_109543/g.244550  ORF Transcript_109543/g.244550 Transcript_109543/m.244550 type:complete len:661 (+) Transcript_109543:145-2127(+)
MGNVTQACVKSPGTCVEGTLGQAICLPGHEVCRNFNGSLVRGTAQLRSGDRRWIPESLFHGQLLCGADFRSSWGQADINCLLLGEDGAAVGAVGPRNLSRADGVSLDWINGSEALNICLAQLNKSVRGLAIVALPGSLDRLDRQPQSPGKASSPRPDDTAGPCEAYVARFAAWEDADAQFPTQLCRATLNLPIRARGTAVILMAFHAGKEKEEPWHLEAVAKNIILPMPEVSGTRAPMGTAAMLETAVADLFMYAGQLPPSDQPKEFLQADVEGEVPVISRHKATYEEKQMAEKGREAIAQAVAAANRLAGQKRREAEMLGKKSSALQKALFSTQESLRRILTAVQAMQYQLESWRRAALLKAQAGNSSEVARMLDQLPSSLCLEALLVASNGEPEKGRDSSPSQKTPRNMHLSLLPGGAAEALADKEEALIQHERRELEQDPKLRVIATRAGDPLGSRPPAATVGDAGPICEDGLDYIDDGRSRQDTPHIRNREGLPEPPRVRQSLIQSGPGFDYLPLPEGGFADIQLPEEQERERSPSPGEQPTRSSMTRTSSQQSATPAVDEGPPASPRSDQGQQPTRSSVTRTGSQQSATSAVDEVPAAASSSDQGRRSVQQSAQPEDRPRSSQRSEQPPHEEGETTLTPRRSSLKGGNMASVLSS